MKTLDDAVLLAYAQGTLSPAQLTALEQMEQSDPQIAQTLRALRASRLPIGAAFAAQVPDPIPPSLQASINDMIAAASNNQSKDNRNAPAATKLSIADPSRRSWIGSWAMTGGAMVATFAVGTLIPTPWRQSNSTDTSAKALNKPWVSAIAQYQALYVRETIDQPTQELSQSQKVLTDTNASYPLAIFIPDLSSAGYRFKRVQRLGYANKPLLQMVYLGNSGIPAALCVLPVNETDQTVTTQQIEGLSVATWQQGGLAYVLVSDMPREQTLVIANALAKRDFPRLA